MRKNLACLNVLLLITISGLLIQVSGQWERHVIDNRIRLGVSVDTADLNGDSKPDLIANSVLDSKLYWYENDFPNWHRHTIDPDADGIHMLSSQRQAGAFSELTDGQFRQYAFGIFQELMGDLPNIRA